VKVTAIRHATHCSLTESLVFRINFYLKFQDIYPGERSSKFIRSAGPIYISAKHHVTGDCDCTARKSSVTCTVCFTDRETVVVKNPSYLESSPSETNVRRSSVSKLFANASLFSWKLNRLSHNV
jgi:hypothetical protein